MFDKYIYISLHFIMKWAGMLNAWAWRKHARMLRAKQQIAMAKLVRRQEAREYFKEKVYQTVIPRNVRLSEAPSHGVPVLIYDKSCPGSKSYYNFTDEFIKQENKVGSAA